MSNTISIRPARRDDQRELHDLAAIDSALPLSGDVLVATVDETAVAAISLDDGRVVADPFRRTADVVGMLRLRAQRINPRRATHGHAPLRARLGLAA
jgi:hypothetical protein